MYYTFCLLDIPGLRSSPGPARGLSETSVCVSKCHACRVLPVNSTLPQSKKSWVSPTPPPRPSPGAPTGSQRQRCPSQRPASPPTARTGDLPTGARHTAASRGTVPTTPADPDGAASSRQSHRLRRPSTTPPPFHAHPHRAVPSHRHLSRPLRRRPALKYRPVGTCRSIARPSLPTPPPSLLCPSCVQYLSFFWG